MNTMQQGAITIAVRELGAEDRDRLNAHFLALAPDDRLLRFGNMITDAVVENYVRALDFAADSVFGVFDDQLQLLGVGHLAHLRAQDGKRAAELGVSVLERARGQGIGSRLFHRAAIRCRNTDVSSLYMHCLSRNGTMMHIAKKAGMAIQHAYGEADAYLTLPPADQASLSLEQRHEQDAASDYALKRRARQTALQTLIARPALTASRSSAA
ncbi:GNAT family N-acetyltransferase [Robbsia sp. Bb-Pol-6]|uniref:GNAT family N-acetyltransferase n=1 Tax=Robbsia betulipollinis TaxID=2981849 RepID=A0ABT3ZRC1_9BURK|nr:GNAT family N-acetyltransferase [Robbsia betulipollinis]MCY0389095.1 GNAT family N-acetyltransferase [Robbsia betulipollinis]